MAERSKALRSGRSLVLQAWVRIPLLTNTFRLCSCIADGIPSEGRGLAQIYLFIYLFHVIDSFHTSVAILESES